MANNNTLLTAFDLGNLDLPQVLAGFVGTDDRNDYYRFTLNQNSQIDFNLTGLTEPGQLSIVANFNGDSVLDSGEEIEFDTIRDTSNSTADRSILRTLAAGTYWARIYTHKDDQNTGYTFSVQATPVPPTSVIDPGNTLAEAINIGNLTTPQTFTDAVGSLDRNDYYRFTLDQNSQIDFNLTGLTEPGQLSIVADFDGDGVLDSGEEIAFDTIFDTSSSTADRSILRTLAAGTYWARIYTHKDDQNTGYTFSAQATPVPSTNLTDPGNSLAEALDLGVLNTPQTLIDVVGSLDRNDFYRFSLAQASDLSLQLTGLSGDADLELIADTDGNGQIDSGETLASAQFSDSRDRNLTYSLGIGSYFIRVLTDNSADNAAYTLNTITNPITLDAANLVVTGANGANTATLGDRINVSWTVANQGTQSALGNWHDYVYISDDQTLDSSDTFLTSLSTGSYTPLATGNSYTVSKDIQLPDSGIGDRYLLFLADGNTREAETNEADNVFALPINLGAPNLVVSGATGPTNASLQETVTLSWTVINQGNRATSSSWRDYVYISEDQILDDADYSLGSQWRSANTPIAVGESYTASKNFTIPNEAGTGGRYLLVVADGDGNDQPESDETDNVAVIPITIGSPNLVLSDATAPTTASLNETIDVSWTVTNSSTSVASANWYDRVYLSQDDILDSSDIRLRSRWTGSNTPLAGGSSYTVNSTIDIPGTAEAGNYHLLFATDAYRNYQTESDETDNVKALPITIGAPNLVVSANTSPNSASLQETVNVSWTVTNQGTGVAPSNWYDAVYISDDQILDDTDSRLKTQQTGSNAPLVAGSSYVASTSITLPNTGIGERYLLFVADNYGDQGESDETDNIAVAPINIAAPNLVLSAANAPSTASLSQYIDVDWTVSNQGAGIASRNWYDHVYLSDDQTLDNTDTRLESQGTSSNTPLNAGESYTASSSVLIPNRVAAGNQYLLFVADGSDDQGETDDTDNLFALPISLAGPDLTVSSVSTLGTAVTGETVGISWTVANQGSAIAEANWSDYIHLSTDNILDASDRRLATAATGNQTPLASGDSYTLNRDIRIPNSVAPGDYHLIVSADGSRNQGEADDTNNTFALPFQVTGRDLRVASANTPAAAQLGETIAVSWSIENIGGADATAGWVDQVYVSDNTTLDSSDRLLAFLPTADQMPLLAGGSYTLSTDVYLPNDISTGDRYLLLVTDGNNEERELNEDNNVLAQAITLNGPDLALTTTTVPTSASLGDNITLSWSVANNGTYSATAPTWSDHIYFSVNDTLDDTDTLIATQTYTNSDTFTVGETYTRQQTLTLPNSLTAGNGHLLIVTDGNAAQGETNESNNLVANAINLSGPDLAISAATAPNSAHQGEMVNVSWTVDNQGTTAALAEQWYDYVYLSQDASLSSDDYFITSENITDVQPLAVGDSYNISSDIFIPSNATTGNRYLLFVSDRDQQQGEFFDDANNVLALPITIESGTLTTDTTWSGKIAISGKLTIPEGVKLTIAPGTIVKFNGSYTGLDVKGTLDVQGTLENPVVLTSWLDDTVGGDNNRDGDASTPAADDWQGITFSGDQSVGLFNYADIRYADRAIYGTQRGAKVELDNTQLTHNNQGIYVYTPLIEVTGNNLLIADNRYNGIFMRADSRGVFRNSTIVNNGFSGFGWTAAGIHQGAANLTVENSIVAFNRNGWHHSGDTPLTTVNNSLFYNPGGREVLWNGDLNAPDLTNNGNRIADPLFVNRFEGNYQLLPGSPAIDSGVATAAPQQDLLGKSRFDDVGIANRGTGTPDYIDIGAYEYQGRTETADLLTTAVTTPDEIAVNVGDTLTTSWTVTNQGEVTTSETWVDKVYLSADKVISADDILLETRQHSAALAPGESYTESLTTTVPASAGPQYILVETDATEAVTESDEINNTRLSAEPLAVNVPLLTLNTPISGAVQAGGWSYFRFDADPGRTIRLDLDAAATSGTVALYSQAGTPPTLTDYGAVAAVNQQPDQTLRLVNPSNGDYYIGIYGQSLTGATSFTLSAVETTPALSSVVQTTVAASGQATLELVGDNFAATDRVKLVAADGTELLPVSVQNQDSTRTFATFDFAGVDLGAYDVVVNTAAGDLLALNDVLTVTAPAANPGSAFFADLVAPSAVRPGREVTLTVNYGNLSQTDLASPLLNLTSNQELEWKLPGSDEWVTDTYISFAALSATGDGDVLKIGANESIELKIRTPLSTEPLEFELYALESTGSSGSNDLIDWNELEAETRPAGVTAEAWAAVWDNVEAQTGDTWGDFADMLAENAAYLQQLKPRSVASASSAPSVYSSDELFAFEILQANGLNPQTYLAVGQDAFASAPGLDLQFSRVYGSSLTSRYTQSDLGYGWTHNYDIHLETTDDNRLLLHWSNGSVRTFVADGSNGYVGTDGEYGIVNRNGDGAYSLREQSGVTYRFNDDLTLAAITDTNGNSITASYTNGKLSALTHSAGQSMSLVYDANGKLFQVSDPTGETTTYTYDASGNYLQQVTTSDNQTTSYTYDTNNRSLTSVTNAAGNTLAYTYDSFNRLQETSLNNGAEVTTYSYDAAGTLTTTDATGTQSQIWFDERGLPTKVQDGEGRTYQFGANGDGNLVQVTQPDGSSSQIKYDANGYPTEITDAEGNTIRLKLDATYGNLQWIQDAKGNTMRYSYDNQGNLEKITYPDGSFESFSTDAQGNLTQYTNRRQQSTTYSYNTDGLIAQQTNPDSTSTDYTYDSAGLLNSITNQQGTTTFDYDANERLQKITYPNNRFLEFTYDTVGRRTQMRGTDGYEVNYSYDNVGRLKQLTDGNNSLIVEYSYDAVGRLAREDKGNGTYTIYDYYADGQIASIVHYAPDGSVNSRFDYTYNQQGLEDSVSTLDGQWSYSYDQTGQLTRAIFASTNPELDNQDLIYVYDAAGNRIRTIQNGVTTEYTTNDLNQYGTVGDATYQYDDDGNLVEKTEQGQTWRYDYNSDNRLVKVTAPDSSITEYEYDVLGNRIATIQDGQRTEYLVDPFGLGNVVAEYGSSGLAAQYTHGLGLESQIAGGNSSYYDFNAVGSTTGLTGVNGGYLNRYNYLPFGQDISETEAITNPFEFVGQWGVMEEANGLDFMRARFYQSQTGKFLSSDPIGLRGNDSNLYRYANNTPVVFADPEGTSWIYPLGGAIVNLGFYLVLADSPTWTGALSATVLGALGGGLGVGVKVISKLPQGTAAAYQVGTLGGLQLSLLDSVLISDDPYNPGSLLSVLIPNPLGNFFNNPLLSEFTNKLWSQFSGYVINLFASLTPEDKYGPTGYDAPNTPEGEEKRYITADETFKYRIDFWNDPDATVSTQTVIIKDQLDPNLDWSTFNFTNFGFLDWNVDVPGGQTIDTRVDMRPNFDLAVDIDASFDAATGEIEWVFQAVDPLTGDYPEDVFAGFLPPFNEETEYELGWVEFTVDPKDDLTTGTQIANQAFVQFDLVNDFNPAPKEGPWINTIDADAPESAVTALPSQVNSDFLVSWTGIDNGSGIANYDIYVSENGSDFTLWLDDTIDTSATYTGQLGSTYSFYSIASDNVGLIEDAPIIADATTLIQI